METLNAAELLAALGHESRLAVFRLLVEAGREGLHASAIGERLGLPGPTLSFHLAHLSRVGLIKGERESRFIHYSAAYEIMDELIAFLTHNCCQGLACLPKTATCDTVEKRLAKSQEKVQKVKKVQKKQRQQKQPGKPGQGMLLGSDETSAAPTGAAGADGHI